MGKQLSISETLTAQQMLEIVLNIYKRGLASETMEAKDLIDEIKRQFLSAAQLNQPDQLQLEKSGVRVS